MLAIFMHVIYLLIKVRDKTNTKSSQEEPNTDETKQDKSDQHDNRTFHENTRKVLDEAPRLRILSSQRQVFQQALHLRQDYFKLRFQNGGMVFLQMHKFLRPGRHLELSWSYLGAILELSRPTRTNTAHMISSAM